MAVVASAHRKGGMRLTTVTTRGELLLLTEDDFVDVPRSIGTVRLPTAFSPNRAEYRKEIARALSGTKLRRVESSDRRRISDGPHAVERDPELRQRMRAAGQTERLERELADLTLRVDGHGQSLARSSTTCSTCSTGAATSTPRRGS